LYKKKEEDQNLTALFAGMFSLSIRFWKIGVGILQHFVLIAVTQLAAEGTVLGTTLSIRALSVVFYCALAHSFVWASRRGVGHYVLLNFGDRRFDSDIELAGWLRQSEKMGRPEFSNVWRRMYTALNWRI